MGPSLSRATSHDTVLVIDHPAPGVRRLRLNRPEVLNALNLALRRRLAQAFMEADADDAVRALILAGSERAFCAGADLHEYRDAGPAEIVARRMGPLWDAVAACRKPVIAAVRGHALGGGCELAMHADILLASHGARFAQPEVLIGLMPGGGATQRLTRAVGKFRAMKLLLTGEAMTAHEAAACGLVSELVPDDQLEQRAVALATQLAQGPQAAIRAIKEAVIEGMNTGLRAGLLLERKSFALLFDEPDKTEGISARLDRRAARFGGGAQLTG